MKFSKLRPFSPMILKLLISTPRVLPVELFSSKYTKPLGISLLIKMQLFLGMHPQLISARGSTLLAGSSYQPLESLAHQP
jgi:hypothetical protein